MRILKNKARKDKNIFLKKRQRVNNSALIFFLILAILFIVIIFRLLYIQVVESEKLTIDALNQITKSEVISSNRGIIYDRNMKELAINISKANVFYNMSYLEQVKNESVSDYKKRKNKILLEDSKIISEICQVDQEEVLEKMKGSKVVRLVSNIDRTMAMKLRDKRSTLSKEKKDNLQAMSVDDVIRRFYPFNNLASYVIGFTNDENLGQYGIEASFDEELTGIPGKNVSQKDNAHNIIPLTEEETFAPKEGYSVVLTLDSNIEQFVESAAQDALKKNEADQVDVIVQDTKSGEILAMASKADYNLNNPKEPINQDQEKNWKSYTDEEKTNIWYDNWRNFNVNDQYEPGSTFKLITASSALEQNTTSPDKTYVCTGQVNIDGAILKCTSHQRGPKTMAQALEQSCNVSFVRIGLELGRVNFLRYIKAYGFGQRTGIELNGEASGLIPSSPDSISDVRLATMSYGHGIAVTPIQLINAVSAISNGGYLNRPRIVKEVVDENDNVIEKKDKSVLRRVISKETSDTMRILMERVVKNGTGKRAQVPGYRIGGKTGTAEIAKKDGTGYEDAYIASFIGVAPIQDPRITVLVIVKNPKGEILGSTVAAPVAGQIMDRILNYLKVPKTEEVKDDKKELVSIPDVTGKLIEDGGKCLIEKGLRFNTNINDIKDTAVIVGQNPSQGVDVPYGSIVDLAIENNNQEKITMPDLSGKSKREIESILNKLKLEYNIKGDGYFISQSPAKGEKLDKDEIVEIVLEDLGDSSAKDDENNSNKEKNILRTKGNSYENKNSENSKSKDKNKKSKKNINHGD